MRPDSLARIVVDHAAWFRGTGVSADGRLIVLSLPPRQSDVELALWTDKANRRPGSKRRLEVWDLDAGEMRRRFVGPEGLVSGIAITPDERHVAVCTTVWGSHGRVEAFSLATGERRMAGEGIHLGVETAPDGRLVVFGSLDGNVSDPTSGEAIESIRSVGSGVVTPDGREVVGDQYPNGIAVVDLRTRSRRCLLEGVGGVTHTVAVSPDGRHVVAATEDGVFVSNLETGELRHTLSFERQSELSDFGYAAAITRDGQHIVSTVSPEDDGPDELVVSHLESGERRRTFPQPPGLLLGVAVTSDGERVILARLGMVGLEFQDVDTGETRRLATVI